MESTEPSEADWIQTPAPMGSHPGEGLVQAEEATGLTGEEVLRNTGGGGGGGGGEWRGGLEEPACLAALSGRTAGLRGWVSERGAVRSLIAHFVYKEKGML